MMQEYHFCVYIMTRRGLTLYVGFTSDIEHRGWQHKEGIFDGFSKTYRCERPVYFEHYQTAEVAIAREKQIKSWSRSKKLALIKRENAVLADLSEDWGKPVIPPEAGG